MNLQIFTPLVFAVMCLPLDDDDDDDDEDVLERRGFRNPKPWASSQRS